MSILKIRDADGSIKGIATFKGDKGEGVPDGGTAGQIMKKTEGGTEWADLSAHDTAVFQNTDISVTSASITQRGLYEVKVVYALTQGSLPSAASFSNTHKFLMSVSDLSETQEQKVAVGEGDVVLNNKVYPNEVWVEYNSQTFTAHSVIRESVTVDSIPSVSTIRDKHSYLAEVRLIIPYE